MQLVTKLPIVTGNGKFIAKRLKRRCLRSLRYRGYAAIEREVGMIFGNEKIKPAMSLKFIRINQKRLNNACHKSERMFLEYLAASDITNFHPNYPLMNRFFGDVVFIKDKLVIEVDGSIHSKESVIQSDVVKDDLLTRFGYRVLRVDPLDFDQVLWTINFIKGYVEDYHIKSPALMKNKKKKINTSNNKVLIENHDQRRSEFEAALALRKKNKTP